jgi:CysZ protein
MQLKNTVFKDVIEGIQAYFSAFSLLHKLKLWKYFTVPIFISLFTASLMITAAYAFSDSIGDFITGFWTFNTGREVVSTISNFIGAFLILIFGLLLYRHIVMAFSAPFMSPVSEKIEKFYLGSVPPSASFLVSLLRAIRVNCRNLVKELIAIIPLLLLSLIPVVGIVFTGLIFLIQAYYAGFGNMDYTLERHYNYKESTSFVKQNKGIAIGNGIVFMALLMIPFIGVILVLPLSVVSASKQTVKRIHQVE